MTFQSSSSCAASTVLSPDGLAQPLGEQGSSDRATGAGGGVSCPVRLTEQPGPRNIPAAKTSHRDRRPLDPDRRSGKRVLQDETATEIDSRVMDHQP